ncbi:hypothetical protein HY025_05945 [Candidatus Daviesbacteria bacterium]|nr:hypothetical protein [Candidatus Daviesbacteria bacterium]
MSHSKNSSDLGFYWPYIAFIVVLILVSAGIGFFLGRYTGSTNSPTIFKSGPAGEGMVKVSPLFKIQTALAQGKITAVNNSSVSIQDDKNQIGSFPLSKNFTVYNQDAQNKNILKASYEVKDIVLNKIAAVNLKVEDGQYKIITITYLNPASSSATSKK